MTSTHPSRPLRRLPFFVMAGLPLIGTLTGCSFIEKQTADAYSITYRVILEGSQINKISKLDYGEAPSRGEDTTAVTKGDAATTNDPQNAQRASWEGTAMVTAEKQAWVSATPPAGTTATCTILIDGTKEIATSTAKAGEPVHCEAVTPAFSKEK